MILEMKKKKRWFKITVASQEMKMLSAEKLGPKENRVIYEVMVDTAPFNGDVDMMWRSVGQGIGLAFQQHYDKNKKTEATTENVEPTETPTDEAETPPLST